MDTRLAVASKRDWRSYADRAVPEDVQQRILDAGRLSGSGSTSQPWLFVVVESEEAKGRVAETVYARRQHAHLRVRRSDRDRGRKFPLDVGRCMQNMMLVAWNEGVVSCPNGMPDADAAARALGLEKAASSR